MIPADDQTAALIAAAGTRASDVWRRVVSAPKEAREPLVPVEVLKTGIAAFHQNEDGAPFYAFAAAVTPLIAARAEAALRKRLVDEIKLHYQTYVQTYRLADALERAQGIIDGVRELCDYVDQDREGSQDWCGSYLADKFRSVVSAQVKPDGE